MASIPLADAKGTITSGQREREGVLGAKGRIWHGLFMGVLRRPFRAQKACVLFAGVCLFLCLFVWVAVVAKVGL